jgi:PilZ domain
MNAHTQTAEPTLAPRPASNAPLFEALVCETHHAAAMTAIVTSCIHGAASGRQPLSRAVIDKFLPPEPAVLLSLTRRSLLEIEPLSETQERIEGFFLSLRVMRRAISTFLFDSGEIGAERAQVLHGNRLSAAASAACHEALRAVRALEAETPGRLPDLYCDHAEALGQVLLAAERQEMPCLDSRGHPYLPVLPQRRRSLRRSIGQNCRILYRKAILSAFAKDISDGGIGLLRVPFLQRDDVVTIELETGRQFRGIVVWCRDEAAGIRFDQPLAASDPLLAL